MTGYKSHNSFTIVHRYFWPQNYPYATMLKDIAEVFVCHVNQLNIYTSSTGEVNELQERTNWSTLNNINIHSLKLGNERQHSVIRKLMNAIYFGIWLIFRLLNDKNEIVMVGTTPPVISATIVRLLSNIKKFKVVYHCQDIHPEGLMINNAIKPGWLYKFLLHLDTNNIANAWKVVVLSEEMKKTLIERGVLGNNIHVVNNFIFHQVDRMKPIKVGEKHKKIRFVFAGTIGRFQNLELLISAIVELKNKSEMEFIFLGEGSEKKKLESYAIEHSLKNVIFKPQVPVSEAMQLLANADIGIVSVSPSVTKVAYPSKSMMYFSAGLPVLAIVEETSDLARLLIDNNIGIAISGGQKKIAAAIQEIANKQKANQYSVEKIKKIAEANFSKSVILKQLSEVIFVE
jgi:glycosyltransferase involved in cell wall biosynthesis